MNVPGDLVKHRFKHVDRHIADTGFNQPTRQQAALAKAVLPIPFPRFVRFFLQLKSLASLGRGHQSIGLVEGGIKQLGIGRGFEFFHRLVYQLAPMTSPICS